MRWRRQLPCWLVRAGPCHTQPGRLATGSQGARSSQSTLHGGSQPAARAPPATAAGARDRSGRGAGYEASASEGSEGGQRTAKGKAPPGKGRPHRRRESLGAPQGPDAADDVGAEGSWERVDASVFSGAGAGTSSVAGASGAEVQPQLTRRRGFQIFS